MVAAVARCNAFGLRPDVVDVWSRLTFAMGYSTLRRELMKLVEAGRLGVTGGTRREFWVSAGRTDGAGEQHGMSGGAAVVGPVSGPRPGIEGRS